MNVFNVIITFFIAIVITLVFPYVFKSRGPWNSMWAFFIILLLTLFAAGLWIIPAGPQWNEVAWVPLLFVGVLFALILAAATYTKPYGEELNTNKPREINEEVSKNTIATMAAFGLFFWLLLISLIVIIAIGLTN
ncbi:MAG: hypothetical protein ACOC3S_03460 [Bacteroidota bacterium]